MKANDSVLKCSYYCVSRRKFLAAGCAACAGAAGLLTKPAMLAASEEKKQVRIRIVYALNAPIQNQPDWPNMGFDFRPVMERINTRLAKLCPGFEFVSSMASGPEEAGKILEQDKSVAVDGYLVSQMNCSADRVVQTFLASGKPVLFADFLYGGGAGFLCFNASLLRNQTPNLGFVASSRIEDMAESVKCFDLVKKGGSVSDFVAATARVRIAHTPKPSDLVCKPDNFKTLSPTECIGRMKKSLILAVRNQDSRAAEPMMGIPVEYVPYSEVNDAWQAVDKDEARAVADRWQKNAAAVIDVSRETLESSAAMYLGMKAVLKKHNANAITINCLGGFYGGYIHAYPCLGFHELNNEGLIGACECDLRSTAAMVAGTALTQGRPGFISDPVIDTSRRQIIYAHCVASNKVFGPEGESNPFEILTHSEDRQGASVRSILPLGYMTTTLEISRQQSQKQIILHQGKAVANDPDDRACRTKLAVEPVGDIEKLFTLWDQWGWHRVTFYGDLKEQVYALADAIGWKVVEEA